MHRLQGHLRWSVRDGIRAPVVGSENGATRSAESRVGVRLTFDTNVSLVKKSRNIAKKYPVLCAVCLSPLSMASVL